MSDADIESEAWRVRPCEWYLEEFKECKRLFARFHQYFVSGKTSSCDLWKEDYDNCRAYRDSRDLFSLSKVLQNEYNRREQRNVAVKTNNVWEYRSTPPEDWSKPLPQSAESNSLSSSSEKKKQKESDEKPCDICELISGKSGHK